MAKLKIKYGRLILTGILWISVYVLVLNQIGFYFFKFRPWVWADWEKRITAFQRGEWVISSGAEWAEFIFMLLLIPVMIIGWVFCYKHRWIKPRHKAERVQPFNPATGKRTFEPAKLRVQSSAILSVPLTSTPPQNSVQPSTGYAAPIPNMAPNEAPQPSPTQDIYPDEQDVQRIMALTAGIKADFFPHVTLDGKYASFAMSTEKLAAVARIINQPDSVWAVDTEVPPEESDWFEQTAILPTPAKDIIGITQNLRENEPGSVATPIILLMSGRLLNVEETLAYFEKNGMMLLRTEEAEADEIPLFSDFIAEYFKPDETEYVPEIATEEGAPV